MCRVQGFTPDVNGRCICDPIVSGPGCCFCAVPGTCGPVLSAAQSAAAAALVVNLHGVVLSSPGGTVFQAGQVRANARGPGPQAASEGTTLLKQGNVHCLRAFGKGRACAHAATALHVSSDASSSLAAKGKVVYCSGLTQLHAGLMRWQRDVFTILREAADAHDALCCVRRHATRACRGTTSRSQRWSTRLGASASACGAPLALPARSAMLGEGTVLSIHAKRAPYAGMHARGLWLPIRA